MRKDHHIMQNLGAALSARYVRSYHITLKIVFFTDFTQSLNNRHIGWTAAAEAASPLQKTAQLHKGTSENKSCVFLEKSLQVS